MKSGEECCGLFCPIEARDWSARRSGGGGDGGTVVRVVGQACKHLALTACVLPVCSRSAEEAPILLLEV